MRIGGVALAIAILLILSLLPHMIQRRTAIMESREGDRFSPDLYLVDPFKKRPPQRDHVGSCRLISDRSIIRHVPPAGLIEGGAMGPAARRPIQGAGSKGNTHELAQLRSRRARRLSAEAASGQRRMAAAGIFAALTVVGTLRLLLAESASWLWLVTPLLGLLSILVVSRRAAVRSEQAEQIDRARYRKLMGQRRSVRGDEALRAASAAPAASSSLDSGEALQPAGPSVPVVSAEATQAAVTEGAAVTAVEPTVPQAAPEVGAAAEEAEGASSEERTSTWTPGVLPVSRYSQGSRVQGKVVHADTDLRGIPRVPASVPARPIAATVDPAARSTEEVAAGVPLAFDLDDVLEARRA